MTTKEKGIHLIEFSGKKSDWCAWSEKFLAWARCKDCKKLLTRKEGQIGVNKIPTQDVYNFAVAVNSEQDIVIVTVRQLN